MNCAKSSTLIDVRPLAPQERHRLIFSTFDKLGPGERMELVNDHDPEPLRQQFLARLPGQFDWSELERGGDTWRVAITRRLDAPGRGGCCGSCGGA